jgi:hypothetical protein
MFFTWILVSLSLRGNAEGICNITMEFIVRILVI